MITGPTIRADISSLSANLFIEAIHCLTHCSVFIYDEVNKELRKNSPQPSVSSKESGYEKYWMIFSTGVEMLIKALLIKHDCLPIQKKTNHQNELKVSAPNYDASINVYNYINSFFVEAINNPSLSLRLKDQGIFLQYELSLGTLSGCRSSIIHLFKKGVINIDEYNDTFNAITTLMDVRRNFDLHNVSNIKVLGSLNGDLDEVYIPVINLLLKK